VTLLTLGLAAEAKEDASLLTHPEDCVYQHQPHPHTWFATLTLDGSPWTHLDILITPVRTRSRFRILEWRTIYIHTWHVDVWPLQVTDPDMQPLASAAARTQPPAAHLLYTGEGLSRPAVLNTVLEALNPLQPTINP
jgi:hypothetical protein